MRPKVEKSENTLERLEDQIDWYDKKSTKFKWLYLTSTSFVFLLAGAIPVLAGFGSDSLIIGAIGALILFIESLKQLNQFQRNWTKYRLTCEALKHEKYLHVAKAGPYALVGEPEKLLAEKIETIVSEETSNWVASQEAATLKPGQKQP